MVGFKATDVPPTATVKFLGQAQLPALLTSSPFPWILLKSATGEWMKPAFLRVASPLPPRDTNSPRASGVLGTVSFRAQGWQEMGSGNQLPWPCRSKEKGRGQCRLRPVPSTGVLGTILTMVRTEGPRSLYSGLPPACSR